MVGLYAQKFKTRHQPITEKHGPVCNVITLEFFVVPDVVFSSYRFSNFSHNRFISSLILAIAFFVLFSAKRSRGSLFSVACGWAMPCTFLQGTPTAQHRSMFLRAMWGQRIMCLVLWGPSCMWPLIVDLFCGCWLPCCRSSEKPRILKGKTAFTDILLSLRACYIHVLYRQDTRSMSTAKTLPYRPPSFRVSGISTLFFYVLL